MYRQPTTRYYLSGSWPNCSYPQSCFIGQYSLRLRCSVSVLKVKMTLTSPLTTDLYELNMIQAYLDRGEDKEAVFEFFVRRLPARRNFLLAAGLGDALAYLETLHFSSTEIDWLKSTKRFRSNFIDYLAGLRFTGA